MKAAIASLFTAISPSDYSHSSGYVRILSSQLVTAKIGHDIIYSSSKAPWDAYDRIYLYQGLPLNGKLGINAFGGVCEANAAILKRLADFDGTIIPVQCGMLDYAKFAEKFVEPKLLTRDDVSSIANHFAEARPIMFNPHKSKTLSIGDSHILSSWIPKSHIMIDCGRTLHSALNAPLVNYVERAQILNGTRYGKIHLNFGNIDLRHHLGRRKNPIVAARDLAWDYTHAATEMAKKLGALEVEIALLLRCETEDRVIPGPGKYKGQNFCGTWDERMAMRMEFNTAIKEECVRNKYLSYFDYEKQKTGQPWKNGRGELNEDVMEKPRSVHIAPKYYRIYL